MPRKLRSYEHLSFTDLQGEDAEAFVRSAAGIPRQVRELAEEAVAGGCRLILAESEPSGEPYTYVGIEGFIAVCEDDDEAPGIYDPVEVDATVQVAWASDRKVGALLLRAASMSIGGDAPALGILDVLRFSAVPAFVRQGYPAWAIVLLPWGDQWQRIVFGYGSLPSDLADELQAGRAEMVPGGRR